MGMATDESVTGTLGACSVCVRRGGLMGAFLSLVPRASSFDDLR